MLNEHSDNQTCDVLVIGAGLAGLWAARSAAIAGARVTLVHQGFLSGSSFVGRVGAWGVQAGLELDGEGDRPRDHFQETMDVGLGEADPELALTLAEQAPRQVRALIEMGVPFSRHPDGGLVRIPGCFGRDRRGVVIRPVQRARRLIGSEVTGRGVTIGPVLITHLLITRRRCVGAKGLDEDGRPVEFRAGAVILATGGGADLFGRSVAGRHCSGAGLVLGRLAGARTVHLAFVQAVLGIIDGRRHGFFPLSLLDSSVKWRDADGRVLFQDRDMAPVFEARRGHYPLFRPGRGRGHGS